MNILIFIVTFCLFFWLTNEISRWFATRPRLCDKGQPCGCRKQIIGCSMYAVCENKPAKEGKPHA
jgi:hypothetical protein